MSNTTYPTVPYYADVVTSVGGGVSESFSVPGLKAGDIVIATLAVKGAAPVSIVSVVAGNNQATVEFSADPSNDHQVNLVALKKGVYFR